MMRSAWLVARNDLRRRLRDKSVIIQGIVAPLAIALVVGSAFGGGPSVSATIGVLDRDQTGLSRQIAEGLTNSTDGGDGVVFTTATGDPRSALESGAYSAIVVLPADLAEQTFAGAPTSLQVVGRASDELSASIAESVAQGIAAQLQTARVTAAAASEVDLDGIALAQEAAARPPPVAIAQAGLEGTFSIITYFAPGIAMLFLFFVIGEGARSLIGERRDGTLARMLATPVTPDSILIGKTIGVIGIGIISITTVWLVTWLGFGVQWGTPLGVFLVIVSVVLAIAGISLLITGLARSETQADALTTIIALLFAVLGGTFFFGAGGPVEQMRVFTPNGQALNAFIDLSAGQAAITEILPTVGILLSVAAITAGFGLVAMRKWVRL